MYQINIEAHFSSAHRLRDYNGECERLHGHNWKVKISVSSEFLNNLGMVMDFRDIKSHTKILVDRLDHQYLNDIAPFTKINPTTENIAKYLFDELSKVVNTEQIKVSGVEIWESPTCSASYTQS